MVRKTLAVLLSGTLVLSGCAGTNSVPVTSFTYTPPAAPPAIVPTSSAQVIKHVVVIFGENISFDHYFGTYPNAANLVGETKFTAVGTPTGSINNYISNPALLTSNPNLSSKNGNSAANPFRMAPAQAGTNDQGHNYTPEQTAFDGGKMDQFPMSVGNGDATALLTETNAAAIAGTTALTMGYFDGNTVTAMWNYAQRYALNDHSFGTTFGPSTPGALNLISGQTNGVVLASPNNAAAALTPDGQGGFTDANDDDPTGDICSSTANFGMSGKNIGDLLNAK